MVWEQHVGVIVMLTSLMENGREKCYRYWPPARMTEEYGYVHVTFEAERAHSNFSARRLYVRDVRRWGFKRCLGNFGWPASLLSRDKFLILLCTSV